MNFFLPNVGGNTNLSLSFKFAFTATITIPQIFESYAINAQIQLRFSIWNPYDPLSMKFAHFVNKIYEWKRMLVWKRAQSQGYLKDKDNFIVSIGISEAKEGTRNVQYS
jgi:hypothetical protein